MRKTIRLTGRRQMAKSDAAIGMREVNGRKVLTMTIADLKAFRGFPQNARVMVKLTQNKQIELVQFGTVGNLKSHVDIENQWYDDPTCQLRVASADGERFGVLLGSTKSWRLSTAQAEQLSGVRGLLNFLPAKIAPRTWKLDIDEHSHPVIRIDHRIPDPRSWAKSDPVFVGTIMPAIIQEVFDDILCQDDPRDTEWMNDWLKWADALMPGNPPPGNNNTKKERSEWIDALVDSFCRRHKLSDRIIDQLAGTAQGAAA